jgi:hypothetical protein
VLTGPGEGQRDALGARIVAPGPEKPEEGEVETAQHGPAQPEPG